MLTFEPVPSSCQFHNLKAHLANAALWPAIEKAHYDAHGKTCMRCGGRGPHWPVELHESWSFDDANRIQTFRGFEVLCPACHEVRHFAFALKHGRGWKARAHLAKVNHWTDALADAHIEVAFATWVTRSATADWGYDLHVLHEVAAGENWSFDLAYNNDLAAWAEHIALRDAADPRRRHVLFRIPPDTSSFAHQGY